MLNRERVDFTWLALNYCRRKSHFEEKRFNYNVKIHLWLALVSKKKIAIDLDHTRLIEKCNASKLK
jgi:hypothetical protein